MNLRHKSYKRQGVFGGLLLAGGAMFLFLAIFSATAVMAEMTPERMQQMGMPAPVMANTNMAAPRKAAPVQNRAGAVPMRAGGATTAGGAGVRGPAGSTARSANVPVVVNNQNQEGVTGAEGMAVAVPVSAEINQPASRAAAGAPVRGPGAVRGAATAPRPNNATQSRAAVNNAVRPMAPQGAAAPQVSRGASATTPALRATPSPSEGERRPATGQGQPVNVNQAGVARAATTQAVQPRPGTAPQGANAAQARAAANRAVTTRATATDNVRATTGRTVAARSATNQTVQQARSVSLSGTAMRSGVRGHNQTNQGGFQAGQWNPVTFSNLIDPLTGMLAADVYSACFEAYYTCMDEICTVRRPGQRRCACAGRVRTFNDVEHQLIGARETLLRVSGELSLIMITRGESIQAAFELTDAERSINCVSFRDLVRSGATQAQVNDWCESRNMLSGTVGGSDMWNCRPNMDTICGDMFGRGTTGWMDVLNGADSDILAGLRQYAEQINNVDTMFAEDPNMFFGSVVNINNIVGGDLFAGSPQQQEVDRLAQMWGYELFQHGHNHVCGRVLDSCFNGVFEMCGSRPADQGGGTGPFNMNSRITVTNNNIDFNVAGTGTQNIGTAQCFGYAANSDPFRDLRRPIAQARLSILQRYVLDANADCDVWGENLRNQLQNVDLQRVAATQLLQRTRLEFAQERENNRVRDLTSAQQDYLRCVDEIWQCRNDQNNSRSVRQGQTNNIIAFCNQMNQVPACYRQMVCDMEATEVITSVNATSDRPQNTVLLSEILSTNNDATDSRERCMRNTLGVVELNTSGDPVSCGAHDSNSIRCWDANR